MKYKNFLLRAVNQMCIRDRYNLLSGKWEFGKVHATETTVEGTTVELNTNGHHATYEMKISGFDLDYKANKVYGAVLTTADGSEYGLRHLANIRCV